MLVVFFLGAPGGLGDRLWTIIKPNADGTGSAQERRDNLKRGVLQFLRHPITGIGMGTFHIIGIKERRAHNSYLEIATELGIFGLMAYLLLIFNPLKSLWRIEQETVGAKDRLNFENYLMSVALQGTLVAYYVNSFFLSLQYLWFVYFPIAFIVGLRRIYEREMELRAAVEAPPELANLHVGDELKGALWRDRQRKAPASPPRPPEEESAETLALASTPSLS
jgi:O-antigen ligase